ncbi:MAG: MFS transporter [Nitrososphaerota archaeon]|nr:MFS transporter [Nitrososphaerota archaeon]
MAAGSTEESGGQIIARLDRIPIWALSYLFIGIIGIGYIFTFFDIFNINASWIQTCFGLNVGGNCAPLGPPGTAAFATAIKNAANYEGPAVLVNLIGYVVGALALSPLSDRIGRRNMLLITLMITGLGSLYNAFVSDYYNFIAARFITGVGIGADLAIVNTYINEAAPKSGRARYTSLLFVLAGIGVFSAIWTAVFLTTPSAPFPYGIPWAINLAGGWRWMYGLGAILALFGILMRLGVPESPRWLISKGRISQADAIVADMERRATESVGTLPPIPQVISVPTQTKAAPFSEIFSNTLYRNRTILLFVIWFLGYMTVYTVAAGATVVLAAIGFAFPENNVIVAVGIIGFVIAGVLAAFLGDKMERKKWLPISAAITLVGALLVGSGTTEFTTAVTGITLIFIGMDFWVPITYAWVSESFPTRARATGFALADGGGHLGGGVGLIITAALVTTLPVMGVMLTIAGFQIASALIAQIGPKTANKRLDEVSP